MPARISFTEVALPPMLARAITPMETRNAPAKATRPTSRCPGRSPPHQDRQGGAQGGAGGDAQDIGIRQRVFDNGLHDHAGEGQGHPHADGQYQTGQPDKPHDVAHTAGAVHL